MKGCRPLSDAEDQAVRSKLAGGAHPVRNVALFVVGCRTGFRISQLLSLNLGDVFQRGEVTRSVYAARRNTKGKRAGQRLPLHEEARAALAPLVAELAAAGVTDPEAPLFQSQKGGRRLNRRSAWEALKSAFNACGLDGKLACHTMRKTFAKRMRAQVGGDIYKLKELLHHTDIRATVKYMENDVEELEAAVLRG